MAWNDEEDGKTYQIIINKEEQYSIWFEDREMPLYWEAVGFSGTKKECLDRIAEIWTDMRPLSLRKKMEDDKKYGK